MDVLEKMTTYVRVVEAGSFSAAAKQLRIAPGAALGALRPPRCPGDRPAGAGTAHRPRRETDGEGARRRGLRTRFDFPPSLNQSSRSHSLSEVSPRHLDAELHAAVSSKPAPSPSPASGWPGRSLARPWI